MFRAIAVAFSTYSRIPMPRIKWDGKEMRYSICCFPLVGAVIGLISYWCNAGLAAAGTGDILRAAVLTALPLLITGGIHMDGFLDTIDAKNSYGDREERLRILKDPHAGAFAVIYGLVYMLVSFGLFSETGKEQMLYVALGYVYSRILSGLSVVFFRRAKTDGMLADTAAHTDRKAGGILLTELLLCIICMLAVGKGNGHIYGAADVAAGLLVFAAYRRMAYRQFGGVTGDLAGYFLQVCELSLLAVPVVLSFIL